MWLGVYGLFCVLVFGLVLLFCGWVCFAFNLFWVALFAVFGLLFGSGLLVGCLLIVLILCVY